MDAFKNSDYDESQKDFLLGLKSELEGLREHIGFVSRHGTEDTLIHRIIARVILQNKYKKAGILSLYWNSLRQIRKYLAPTLKKK